MIPALTIVGSIFRQRIIYFLNYAEIKNEKDKID